MRTIFVNVHDYRLLDDDLSHLMKVKDAMRRLNNFMPIEEII